MALNVRQQKLLTEAIVAWIRTQSDTWPITMLRASPTQIRNVLGPFVRAIRDRSTSRQVELPAARADEDADLVEQVDDANQVLQDLDDAIVP